MTTITRMKMESKKKNFGSTGVCLVSSFCFVCSYFFFFFLRKKKKKNSLTSPEINFSVLVPDQAGNFLKRGGSQEPTSPEKEAQEHREATTLMVFYTSPGDIPP